MQMVQDITAVPEIGKTYLGKVVRLAEFGAFVEIFPGTDGLLHISEIAEHRVAKVEDELRDGDQILVKVIALEGNRIKLSRKAVLKEQRAALGLPDPEPEQGGGGGDRGGRSRDGGGDRGGRSDRGPRGGGERSNAPAGNDQQPRSNQSTITIEGGDDFEDDNDAEGGEEGDEPNFNREGAAGTPGAPAGGRPAGGGGRRRRGGRRGGGGGGNAGGGSAGGNR
jgi:polyribonucleotide nucleotidyltransferase